LFLSGIVAMAPLFHCHPVFEPLQLIPALLGTQIPTLPKVVTCCAMPTPTLLVNIKGLTVFGNASTAVKA